MIAIIIVTIDKAEDIGVTSITSPIVNPQLTHATAAASKIPTNTTIDFVLVVVLAKFRSLLTIRENNNKNKITPIFTKRVVDTHPIS